MVPVEVLVRAVTAVQGWLSLGVPLTLSVHIDPRLREAGLARAHELRDWLQQRYEDAVAAAAVNNSAGIGMFVLL